MRATVDFFLFDWLAAGRLTARARYADHSRATFAEVLDTCERIAREKVAPFNREADTQEPSLVDGRVVLPQSSVDAALAYVRTGLLAAAQDYEDGGMQLPCVVEMAANAFYAKAGVGVGGGMLLTSANANLLRVHGSDAQRAAFARPQFAGRWFGTMCLSEPQAGSSLSDITTRAEPDGGDYESDPLGPRHRIHGHKMWISNGDHEITENIVHLVLAKIPGSDGRLPPGAPGISLFIVPKQLVAPDGQLTGTRNDVVVAGLNHKLGYRGVPNTVLNFGEGRHPVAGRSGAIGYRVGAAGDGLRCMFHMMNEARIAVGLGAAMIGYSGFEASLAYARERRQGRPVGPRGKDPTQSPVRIIEHADVRRMLLAQKAYVEGGLALALYCARLVDEQRSADPPVAAEAALLLELLTPIAKSWPSEWCLEANSLAIQVLGGCGYTRDFPVEQLWRDNRLNMIHEGTHGIQALDLLGRKVTMRDGAGLALLAARVGTTASAAAATPFRREGAALRAALERLVAATRDAWATKVPEEALANATPYLQAFGHLVIAWIWLDVALATLDTAEASPAAADFLRGKQQAMRYFFEFELGKIDPWLAVVASRSPVCREMREEWFQT